MVDIVIPCIWSDSPNTQATGIILDYLQDLAGTSLKCDTIPEDVTPVVII
jgi:hypothetical protein